jgi:methanogenic corrinoid protein MtbC1
MPPRAIYLEVLAPALHEVGTRWQRGLATVAQEHLATSVVTSIMAGLAGLLREPRPVGRRAVLACTDGERHEVGLRMVGDFLEGDGWEVFYLGASTPGSALGLLVDRVQPDVVGLSTTLGANLEPARTTVAALRERGAPPFILLGGAGYGDDASLARQVGADAYAADARAASALLRSAFGRWGADSDGCRLFGDDGVRPMWEHRRGLVTDRAHDS